MLNESDEKHYAGARKKPNKKICAKMVRARRPRRYRLAEIDDALPRFERTLLARGTGAAKPIECFGRRTERRQCGTRRGRQHERQGSDGIATTRYSSALGTPRGMNY